MNSWFHMSPEGVEVMVECDGSVSGLRNGPK